jgi:hypothetical protein
LILTCIKEKKQINHLAWTVLILQFAGLFFCGEPEPLHSAGNEACKTLLCSIYDGHDAAPASSTAPQEDSCHCTCNFTYDVSFVGQIQAFFASVALPVIQPAFYIAAPPYDIDHIPRI